MPRFVLLLNQEVVMESKKNTQSENISIKEEKNNNKDQLLKVNSCNKKIIIF